MRQKEGLLKLSWDCHGIAYGVQSRDTIKQACHQKPQGQSQIGVWCEHYFPLCKLRDN